MDGEKAWLAGAPWDGRVATAVPSAAGDGHRLLRGQDSAPTLPLLMGCPLLTKTVKPTCHLPFCFWISLQTAKTPLQTFKTLGGYWCH